MDREPIQDNDLILGSLVLMAGYSFDDMSSVIKEYDQNGNPVFNDRLLEFTREKGRLFREFVKKMDHEKGWD